MALTRSLPIRDKDFRPSGIATSRERYYADIDLTFDVKSGPAGVPLSGDVFKKLDVAAVFQALKNLLLTNRFEKPFNPEFGGDITSLLFENTSDVTASDVRNLIQSAVDTYEPRVEILDIETEFSETRNGVGDDNSVNIQIVFKLRNTQDTFTFTTTLNRLR